MEASGTSTQIKLGNKDGSSPKSVGRPQDFTGDETAIVYNKSQNKYYIVVNNQLVEYDPVTYRRRVLYEGVSAVSVDPTGNVIFSKTDGDKSQVGLIVFKSF